MQTLVVFTGKLGNGFDARLVPVRGDLAADYLVGHELIRDRNIATFAQATPMQVTISDTSLRKTPQPDGAQETQCLFGEVFHVYEELNDWLWGQAETDSYVGYIAKAALTPQVYSHTHSVSVLRTYRYTGPHLKTEPLGLISMNANVAVTGKEQGRFVEEARGGWVIKDHLKPFPIQQLQPPVDTDLVDIAVKFLGTPYLWGGRTSFGLDCSALVQNAYAAMGISIPRDTDQISNWMLINGYEAIFGGVERSGAWQAERLQRGDVVFWKGHIALMVDEEKMVHANGTHMMVTLDEVRSFSGAVAAEAGDIISILRRV